MYKFLAGLTILTFVGCDDGSSKGTESVPVRDDSIILEAGDEDGDGYSVSEGDCDDANAEVNPGKTEICNGLDDNCSGEPDEGVLLSFYADADGDGFGDANTPKEACEAPSGYVDNSTDCNDATNQIYPGATEICDNLDNNCDSNIDEGVTNVYHPDADGDTFGDSNTSIEACEAPNGYVVDSSDCDDSKATAFPGNMEVCDEVDNNCNGLTDEGVTTTFYADIDGDAFGNANLSQQACSAPAGYVRDDTDCDDQAAAVNPAATEVCNNIDDNCDGNIDENTAADAQTWYQDQDGDGYGSGANSIVSCTAPRGYVSDNTDCDDSVSSVNPGASEVCNSVDDNCDGLADNNAIDATTWYIDVDGDTYGSVSNTVTACTAPNGYVSSFSDCNDGSNRVYPGATEYCDTLDNNCDGRVDEDSAVDATTWYQDFDGDNYGNAAVIQVSCSQPSGYISTNNTDCNDNRAASYPGAPEYCNGFDDDCDGTVDEDAALDVSTWYQDSDGDNYGNHSVTDIDCAQPTGFVADDTDCNDGVATTYPGAPETCNGVDDDCDGSVDESGANGSLTWYRDADTDGYGDVNNSQVSCNQPSGYVSNSTDCNDLRNEVYPGADEYCDGLDNDCDGTVDNNPVDGNTYYVDTDNDGMGDPNTTTSSCSLPSGYSENAYDCNDSNGSEPVVADAINGSNSGTGTFADPYYSLQAAVADAYECVVALPGTYSETIDLSGKSIDVWGVAGPTSTTIDPNASLCNQSNPTACEAAVTIASGGHAQPTLRGFTVSGGSGYVTSSVTNTTCADSSASHNGQNTCSVTIYEYYGGGIYINGDDPILQDLVVRNNTLPDFIQVNMGSFSQYWLYSYGGGIAVLNSNTTLDEVDVSGNYADQGGGVYITDGAVFTFEHGFISENDATDGAGLAVSGATAYLTNAGIACNVATTDGGGVYTETSGLAYLTNTAFSQNNAASGNTHGADVYVGTSTNFYLYNSIVEANSLAYALYGVGSGSIQYSNVVNANTGGTYGGSLTAGTGSIGSSNNLTNITCDGNPNNDNYTLRSTSASINSGNPSPAYNDVNASRNDMGVYGGPGGVW